MNRDDRKVFLHAGLIAAFVMLFATLAHAEPCPPKRYFCWQAKLVFEAYGVERVVAKARQCGWPDSRISEAKRCQK